ncbi:nucleoside triphosphate pyrophosphohydrolase family protein [uncultured Paraglaciecola sp.]|uniref:nucleoside triphosphate pyrophosphohydrolase family protein n=1 Tax=uncultured Paraglaciecola sp. TaxID=1765024 RepID=UPI002604D9FF|nr:nucleoside triphosphate pyrophosphohydrolase family protein [uncultured Paraglaciecola sp.]
MNTYADFVAEKLKPAETIVSEITSKKVDLLHAAVGLSGESGECLDLVKKHAFNNKPLDEQKLIEEMGDCEFYLAALRNALGISRQQVIDMNIVKLSKRYKSTYTDAEAIARGDER